jgi:hypothetical protein
LVAEGSGSAGGAVEGWGSDVGLGFVVGTEVFVGPGAADGAGSVDGSAGAAGSAALLGAGFFDALVAAVGRVDVAFSGVPVGATRPGGWAAADGPPASNRGVVVAPARSCDRVVPADVGSAARSAANDGDDDDDEGDDEAAGLEPLGSAPGSARFRSAAVVTTRTPLSTPRTAEAPSATTL